MVCSSIDTPLCLLLSSVFVLTHLRPSSSLPCLRKARPFPFHFSQEALGISLSRSQLDKMALAYRTEHAEEIAARVQSALEDSARKERMLAEAEAARLAETGAAGDDDGKGNPKSYSSHSMNSTDKSHGAPSKATAAGFSSQTTRDLGREVRERLSALAPVKPIPWPTISASSSSASSPLVVVADANAPVGLGVADSARLAASISATGFALLLPDGSSSVLQEQLRQQSLPHQSKPASSSSNANGASYTGAEGTGLLMPAGARGSAAAGAGPIVDDGGGKGPELEEEHLSSSSSSDSGTYHDDDEDDSEELSVGASEESDDEEDGSKVGSSEPWRRPLKKNEQEDSDSSGDESRRGHGAEEDESSSSRRRRGSHQPVSLETSHSTAGVVNLVRLTKSPATPSSRSRAVEFRNAR